jgi:hypothetical protein
MEDDARKTSLIYSKKKVNEYSYRIWIKNLLLFFVFFPYITLIDTPWSLQPYALFCSILFLITVKHRKTHLNIYILLFVAISSILIAFIKLSDLINSVRSVANYISMPIIVWALYKINLSSIHVIKFVKLTAIIYFIVGILQLSILPGFLSFLVPHQAGAEFISSSGRGVSSLTPEPSYFGFIMLLYFFIGIITKERLLIIISLFSIIFLSQSFSVISVLVVVIFLFFTLKSLKTFFISIFLSLIVIAILVSMLNNFSTETRSLILLSNLFADGFSSTIENDASAAGRLYHISYPIISAFTSFFIPFGYNGLPNGDTRILSGIAGAIYELGFFSFLLLYVICNILFCNNFLKINLKVGIGIGMLLFLLNANQVGMPIYCFILSYFLYSRKIHL